MPLKCQISDHKLLAFREQSSAEITELWSCLVSSLQIKPLALRPLKVSKDETVQELSPPHRSNSKEQLSEVSPQLSSFPPSPDLLLRARLSTFTGQGGGGGGAWGARGGITESRQRTATRRPRSEGSWCSSACWFPVSPHKSAARQGKDWSAGSTQTGND